MNGLGASAQITGEGYVMWKFRDDFGVVKRVKVKSRESVLIIGFFSGDEILH